MKPADKTPTSATRTAAAAPRSALIVDDEPQLLRLMARLLERAGYQTWLAGDGVEAGEIFDEHVEDIDLALIDVMHPPGAGAADLLPELLAKKPDLEVILTSGAALPDALAETLTAIGGRFLRKPFVPNALMRLLEEDSKDGAKRIDPNSAPPGPGPGIA